MTGFGDDEPEDAWDATDDRTVHIRNLILRLSFLDDHLRDPRGVLGGLLDPDDPDVLEAIADHVARQSVLPEVTDRDRLRIAGIFEDVMLTEGQP